MSASSGGAGGAGGDDFYKAQLEIANKEKTQLQERLRVVESRNALLTKALYEVSVTAPPTPVLPFDVVQALKNVSIGEQAQSAGKGSAYRRAAPDERAVACAAKDPSSQLAGGTAAGYVPFCCKADLKGHASAVYAIQFSPNGQLLASTSYDRSVCIWAMDKHLDKSNYEPKLSVSDAHRAPVVAVEWTSDSARVITGGFDQSAAEWDVGSGTDEAVARFPSHGLVNAVSVSPADDALFFASTSRRAVHLFDRRVPPLAVSTPDNSSIIVLNDTVVNSIHITLDGHRFLTGDHGGAIRTWDLRMVGPASPPISHSRSEKLPSTPGGVKPSASLLDTTYNDVHRRPITHVHTSPPAPGDNHGRFLAVNSYDNYLRVYDRGSFVFEAENAELKPMHALRGVHNRNWPIKSSFFLGADYRPPRVGTRRQMRRRRSRSLHAERSLRNGGAARSAIDEDYGSVSEDEDESSSFDSSSDNEVNGHSPTRGRQHSGPGGPIQSTLTLATGSADSSIYIFDVGGKPGTGELVQTLDGHRDRVYSVDFHPREPILASCSADSEIKIWGALKRGSSNVMR